MFSGCRDDTRRRAQVGRDVAPSRATGLEDSLHLDRHGTTRAAKQPRRDGGLHLGLRVMLVFLFGTLSLCARPGTRNPEFQNPTAAANPSERVLRVAADPNNLPFSNERGEGFENRIAELVARELDARLEYFWWPQRRGFVRETLGNNHADVVMGMPAGFERVLTTRPYYRSTYVFVYRRGEPAVKNLEDERLREVNVGVQLIGDDFNNTPPAHALSARGIVANVRGYSLYGDYAKESPPSEIVKAVANHQIDVALAWGPMAGFFARRQAVPLEIAAIEPERDGPARPFTFAIAMGVKRGNDLLKRELDEVIVRRGDEIEKILSEFNVPQLPLKPREEAGHVAAR